MTVILQLKAPTKYRDPSAEVQSAKPSLGLSIQLRRETPLVPPPQVDSGMCLTDRPDSAQPGKKGAQSTQSPARDTSDDYSDTFDTEAASSVHSPSAKKQREL